MKNTKLNPVHIATLGEAPERVKEFIDIHDNHLREALEYFDRIDVICSLNSLAEYFVELKIIAGIIVRAASKEDGVVLIPAISDSDEV